MTITKSVLCDATPSWNGYNYQGKVGLYVSLENILIEARKGIDTPLFEVFLNNHHIEYEWIEDFAIKEKDSYLSLHQVKHKGENKFTDHVEAIATILHRKSGVLSDTDIFKYFTIKSIKKGDAAATKIRIKRELTVHKLIDDNGILDINWKVNVSAIDSRYRDDITKCFSDFELLVQKAFNSSVTYFHTADKVGLPSDDICNINGIPSHLVSGLANTKSLSCKNIYLSFDHQSKYNLALSDYELNCKLELQIDELLKLFHPGENFLEKDVKLYKTALCALIDQNLVKRHQYIREKTDSKTPYLQRTKPSVYFKKIITELRKNYRVQDDRYWNLVCRENFEVAYKEKLADLHYSLNNSYIGDDLYNQYQSNLELLRIDVIDQYLPNDCVAFLRQIYPHRTRANLLDHQFYTAISEPIKIKKMFLNFFSESNEPVMQFDFELQQ